MSRSQIPWHLRDRVHANVRQWKEQAAHQQRERDDRRAAEAEFDIDSLLSELNGSGTKQ